MDIEKSYDKFLYELNLAEDEAKIFDIVFNYLFSCMDKNDGFFEYVLNLKENGLNLKRVEYIGPIENRNSKTGKYINDITMHGSVDLFNLNLDKLNILMIIEIQNKKDYGLPIRLREYKEYIHSKYIIDLLNIKSLHEVNENKYRNIGTKIPLIIPVIINLDNKYNYFGEGEKIFEGFYKYNFRFDYTNINKKYLEIYDLFLDDFSWYQINFKDAYIRNSILTKINEIYHNHKKGNIREAVNSMFNKGKYKYEFLEDILEFRRKQNDLEDENLELKDELDYRTNNTIKGLLKMGLSVEEISNMLDITEEEINIRIINNILD